jgi:hypothetical protein
MVPAILPPPPPPGGGGGGGGHFSCQLYLLFLYLPFSYLPIYRSPIFVLFGLRYLTYKEKKPVQENPRQVK